MHRFTHQNGIDLIKHFEGFRETPYVCSGGYLTIGYGHKLLPSDRFNAITIEKAEKLLKKDLMRSERAVLKYINHQLDDYQFAALVSFTFNLGPAALQRSSLRAKINYGEIFEASKEFKKWVYAGGKRVSGLVKRRRMESEMFLHSYCGEYSEFF